MVDFIHEAGFDASLSEGEGLLDQLLLRLHFFG